MNEYLDRISSFSQDINNDDNYSLEECSRPNQEMTMFHRSSDHITTSSAAATATTVTAIGPKSQPNNNSGSDLIKATVNNTKNQSITRGTTNKARGARGSRGGSTPSRGKKNPSQRGKNT